MNAQNQALAEGSTMLGPYEQSAAAKAAYDARWARIMACVRLEQPTACPWACTASSGPPRTAASPSKELMYDYGKAKKACLDVVTEFEPDGVFPLLMGTALGNALEKLDFKQLQWPGHGVGRDAALPVPGPRVHEGRGVRRVSLRPTGFYIHTYLPRVAGAFEGFDKLPDFLGLHYFRLVHGIRPFALPEVRGSFDRIVAAAEEVNVMFSHHLDWVQQVNAAGYPLFPRGQLRLALRLHRRLLPRRHRHDEGLVPAQGQAQAGAGQGRHLPGAHDHQERQALRQPIVFIPTHWAPDAFMSQSSSRSSGGRRSAA